MQSHTFFYSQQILPGENHGPIEEALNSLKKRRGIEFFVATVKTTGRTDIADYTKAVLGDWGIKDEQSGLLLLLAIDDRKYHFEISQQLEDKLPIYALAQAGRLIVPSARQGKYGEGLLKSVSAIIAHLDEEDAAVSPKVGGNKRR